MTTDATVETPASHGEPPRHSSPLLARHGAVRASGPDDGVAWHYGDPTAEQHPVEVLVADPSGRVGLFVGAVGKGRIDLVSDLIARAPSGADVSAEKRLYGLVNGELMWAHDIAAFGQPMQSYASGRLSRVEAEELP